nr:reverse transcriptase domain-containing protein [Tanacetum cinerariifolium]
MLYGSECWPITKALANKVEVVELRILRWTCVKTLLDMIPNGVYRAHLEVEMIINKMRKGRLRWFKHIRRQPQSTPVRRVEALVVDDLSRKGTSEELELGRVSSLEVESYLLYAFSPLVAPLALCCSLSSFLLTQIRYHPCKANVVADALRMKEWVNLRGVRALSMMIHSSIKTRILEARNEASKDVNTLAEMLRGLDKQFERKEDGGLYFVERI